jgi:hypothetical protein
MAASPAGAQQDSCTVCRPERTDRWRAQPTRRQAGLTVRREDGLQERVLRRHHARQLRSAHGTGADAHLLHELHAHTPHTLSTACLRQYCQYCPPRVCVNTVNTVHRVSASILSILSTACLRQAAATARTHAKHPRSRLCRRTRMSRRLLSRPQAQRSRPPAPAARPTREPTRRGATPGVRRARRTRVQGRCKADARQMQGRCKADARQMQGREGRPRTSRAAQHAPLALFHWPCCTAGQLGPNTTKPHARCWTPLSGWGSSQRPVAMASPGPARRRWSGASAPLPPPRASAAPRDARGLSPVRRQEPKMPHGLRPAAVGYELRRRVLHSPLPLERTSAAPLLQVLCLRHAARPAAPRSRAARTVPPTDIGWPAAQPPVSSAAELLGGANRVPAAPCAWPEKARPTKAAESAGARDGLVRRTAPVRPTCAAVMPGVGRMAEASATLGRRKDTEPRSPFASLGATVLRSDDGCDETSAAIRARAAEQPWICVLVRKPR